MTFLNKEQAQKICKILNKRGYFNRKENPDKGINKSCKVTLIRNYYVVTVRSINNVDIRQSCINSTTDDIEETLQWLENTPSNI